MVSHDLRTPLTVIQGHAELLQGLVAAGAAMASIEEILAGCQRMLHMMEDLLDMANLSHERPPIELQPIDLKVFLTDFLRRYEISLATERIRLALPADLPPVLVNPATLERILVNLLTNALKYSTTPIRVSACRYAQEVRISVADRGRGIDPGDLARIFDRFFRARTAAGARGYGLGLYISRLLVEGNRGRIWAISRPARGTVFFFNLPAEASKVPSPAGGCSGNLDEVS